MYVPNIELKKNNKQYCGAIFEILFEVDAEHTTLCCQLQENFILAPKVFVIKAASDPLHCLSCCTLYSMYIILAHFTQRNNENLEFERLFGSLHLLFLLRNGIEPGPHWPEANAITTTLQWWLTSILCGEQAAPQGIKYKKLKVHANHKLKIHIQYQGHMALYFQLIVVKQFAIHIQKAKLQFFTITKYS